MRGRSKEGLRRPREQIERIKEGYLTTSALMDAFHDEFTAEAPPRTDLVEDFQGRVDELPIPEHCREHARAYAELYTRHVRELLELRGRFNDDHREIFHHMYGFSPEGNIHAEYGQMHIRFFFDNRADFSQAYESGRPEAPMTYVGGFASPAVTADGALVNEICVMNTRYNKETQTEEPVSEYAKEIVVRHELAHLFFSFIRRAKYMITHQKEPRHATLDQLDEVAQTLVRKSSWFPGTQTIKQNELSAARGRMTHIAIRQALDYAADEILARCYDIPDEKKAQEWTRDVLVTYPEYLDEYADHALHSVRDALARTKKTILGRETGNRMHAFIPITAFVRDVRIKMVPILDAGLTAVDDLRTVGYYPAQIAFLLAAEPIDTWPHVVRAIKLASKDGPMKI